MDAFPDLTAFIVLSEEPRVVQANFASTPNASAITSITNTSIITTTASRNLSRRALACVTIVRTDLDNNGKPSNLILHNHTVHVNIYSEEQACVTYLLHKIREEMVEEDLVLVGLSGLVIYDQDGTRGKLLVSFFVTLWMSMQSMFWKLLWNNILINPVIKRHLFLTCFRDSSSEMFFVLLRKICSMIFSHGFAKGLHETTPDPFP